MKNYKYLLLGLIFLPVIASDDSTFLPNGDYQDSCQNCSVSDSADQYDVMTCQCERPDGTMNTTSIALDDDADENTTYSNNNGNLIQNIPQPGGSYTNTCTGCNVNLSNVMTCSCLNRSQKRVTTSITLQAGATYSNNNGVLQKD